MTSEIVALRCPSCGGAPSNPSREMPFGAEFRCDDCGVTSVLIVERALVPLGILEEQGGRVCTKCGRIAPREARFCPDGHALIRKCAYPSCNREFAIDHQRCDFCGGLQSDAPQLHQIYQGTVTRIEPFGAYVNIGCAEGLLHISEIAEHRVRDVSDALKVGQHVSVKIIKFRDNGALALSCKELGRT